ncbi:MAG: hypothetical protein LBV33_01655 [Lachnospiraceae bacterium]|jgi:GTPase SAR1 family protein|nr:hypothetical protein [Lachnospiraceae bacterium]
MDKQTWEKNREAIAKRLKGLSKVQMVNFAWLCAVRSLPFLSSERGFNYWEEKKQIHLYSIFEAMDLSIMFAINDRNNVPLSFKTVATIVATDADVATDVATVVYAVAVATAYDATTATVAATDTTAAAAIRLYSTIPDIKTDPLKIILNDLELIKKNTPAIITQLNDTIEIYPDLFSHFIEDLKENDCHYWANLYENLFINGIYDREELLRRHIVPEEIRAQGAAAVGHYLEQLGDEVELINEARIIILGEKGAGKTSLARKLIDLNAQLPDEDESTAGVSVLPWRLAGEGDRDEMLVHIWDFAGHSITHAAHRCFMSSRCLYIYVYNGRVEHDNRSAYWLEQIKLYGGGSPVLFLVNEKDRHQSDIAKKTLRHDFPLIQDYYHVDIGHQDKERMRSFRQTVMDFVRGNPSWNQQEISAATYRMKRDLQSNFTKRHIDAITLEQFHEIADRNGLDPESARRSLQDLHTLGICLWYNEETMQGFNALIMNPGWITDGIYKIINWGHNNARHILSLNDGRLIFTNPEDKQRYPQEKVKFLFELMRVYELAFFKDENQRIISIPSILPIDRPDGLPEFVFGERLVMEFRVRRALPPDVIARLIVRRNHEIFAEEELWREGALLHYHADDSTIATIIEDDRNIIVTVKGGSQTEYLAELRDTIRKIFDSYKAIEPELFYEVLVSEEMMDHRMELLYRMGDDMPGRVIDEKQLKGISKHGGLFYYKPVDEMITLDKTLKGYGMNLTIINNYELSNCELTGDIIGEFIGDRYSAGQVGNQGANAGECSSQTLNGNA